MSEQTAREAGRARLVELVVADPPDAWLAAGFTVEPDEPVVRLGETWVRLAGRDEVGAKGIVGWTLSGVDLEGSDLDGLPTSVVSAGDRTSAVSDAAMATTDPPSSMEPPPFLQPNGATGIDHVVVATPDLDRTIGALESAGLECRRIRDTESNGSPMRQAFFRLGPTVLEVVSGGTGSGTDAGDSPSRWFGLALDVADLDVTAAFLGDRLGRIKTAVQPGRRIATLRHRDLGLSVAVAAMDDHGNRDGDGKQVDQ